MKREQPCDHALTAAEMSRIDIDALVALELATRRLSDTTQSQAARYQRQAQRMRKEIERRRRAFMRDTVIA